MDPPDFGADIISDILKNLSDEDIENIAAAAQSFTGNTDKDSCENDAGGFAFEHRKQRFYFFRRNFCFILH